MNWLRWSCSTLGVLCAIAAVAGDASAQVPAAAEAHAEAVATRHTEDDVRVGLTAGTALSYGNARNLAVNLGGEFVLRLDQHSLYAGINWIFGFASLRDADTSAFTDWDQTTNNLTWKLRYDLFLSDDDAIFAVHHGRRDPFAQLRPRLGFQVGYMRNFVREEKHRFWGEIGYDFTYDRFGRLLDVGGGQVATDRTLHSLRLFIGYDNRLNDVLTYTTGLEALMRLDRPEHWRFEWVNQIRSKLTDWLQVSVDVTGRLDSLPPGQAEAWNEQAGQPTQMFDLITTLNLVGSFDLHTPPSEEEEEEEEACPACPDPVCPEPTCPDGEQPEPVAETAEGAEPAPDAAPEEAADVETEVAPAE